MSIIVKTFCHFILQITLLLSVLLLLRGHNYPGGGFIGALIACTGVGFYTLAYKNPPKFLAEKQVLLINIGILCLTASILLALLFQKTLLTGIWWEIIFLGDSYKLGTPLLFDAGIYFSVLGGLLWILTDLEKTAYV